MIHSILLTSSNINTIHNDTYWLNLIHQLSIKNFNNVPQNDIAILIKKVKSGHAIIRIIYENATACGFGVMIFRSVSLNNAKIDYLLLDVGCIDYKLQNNKILTFSAIKEILIYK